MYWLSGATWQYFDDNGMTEKGERQGKKGKKRFMTKAVIDTELFQLWMRRTNGLSNR